MKVRIRCSPCPQASQSQEGRQMHKQMTLIQRGQCGLSSLDGVLQTPIRHRSPSPSLGAGCGEARGSDVEWLRV